jgi:hypothetical protein
MKKFEAFLITIFVIIDDLCNAICPQYLKSKKGTKPTFSDSEVITFAIAQSCYAYASENKFYKFFNNNFKHLFPNLVDRTQINRRIKNLQFVIEWIRNQFLKMLGLTGSEDRVVDSTPIQVMHFKRAHYTPLFKGEADYGYCASKNETYYGFKLHLMTTFAGIPTDFKITSASTDDRDALEDILEYYSGIHILGDKGYLRSWWQENLKIEKEICLWTPKRSNQKSQNPNFINCLLSKTRGIIETINDKLKDEFNLVATKTKTFIGLQTRILTKITALTFCIYLNKLLGNDLLATSDLIF